MRNVARLSCTVNTVTVKELITKIERNEELDEVDVKSVCLMCVCICVQLCNTICDLLTVVILDFYLRREFLSLIL